MPDKIQQKFWIIQDNSTQSSTIKAGPFQDRATANIACQQMATVNVGVQFAIVKSVGGFGTDKPIGVPLEFADPLPGDPPLDP